VYLLGTGLTALSHLGFAMLADGFWSGFLMRAIAGIGWAGAYMPGLKAIADPLTGATQSRAVSWHAAGVGIAGAGSFAVAGLFDVLAGPRAAFLFGAAAAAMAFLIAMTIMPSTPPRRTATGGALLDFRPVFRNRRAMAWIVGYTVHTWELAALRAWGVTFLTVSIARLGAPGWLPSPDVLFTFAGLAGVAISVTGNETAQRYGRNRVVLGAMLTAALLSLLAGWTTGVSVPFAVVAVFLWNMAIYIDSSALTAGTVQAADPQLRGATMGLHSMSGYAGGFVGPLGVGLMLDLFGGDSVVGWGLAFGHLGVITLAGLAVLRKLDRTGSTVQAGSIAPKPVDA
jgi:MFS family permease